MQLTKHLERLQRVHRLIRFHRTGSPEEFAAKLGVSQSYLYRYLAELKAMGAPIHYCHIRRSYAYYERVDLKIGFFDFGGGKKNSATAQDLTPLYA